MNRDVPPTNSFADRLVTAIKDRRSPIVVGLDPRIEHLPSGLIDPTSASCSLEQASAAFTRFCCGVIDVVSDLVPAVKPQAACFERLGAAGMQSLADVIRHASRRGMLVILDGKRNDIGSTATAYAQGYLGADSPWGADALTVSPYLGHDSLQPFVEVAGQRSAGIFILVKTSNPGGGQFQDLVVDGQPLYRRVAEYVERLAVDSAGDSGYGLVGAVVGATYPQQLAELRSAMPHTFFLVPGYGSQGGTAHDVAPGFDSEGLGAIINNSRGIIFAHERKEFAAQFGADRWQQAVDAATRDMLDRLRSDTPAGRL